MLAQYIRCLPGVLILLVQSPCLALSPSQEEVALGKNFSHHHQQNQAIPHFNNAIRLDPNNLDAYINRAAAYLVLDENEKAIKDLDLVIKNRKDSLSYRMRSQAWSNSGNLDRAISDMSEALVLSTNTPDKIDRLAKRAELYRVTKREKEALVDITEAIKLSKEPISNFYYQRGCIYFKTGDYKKAVVDYTSALNCMKPNDTRRARYYAIRAKAYEKLGRSDLAKADMNKTINDSADRYGTP